MFFNFHTHFVRNPRFEIINLEENFFHLPSIYSYGIHPFSSKTYVDEDLLTNKNCVALGEIGLDKNSPIPFDQQLEMFKKQVRFSEKYNLPVILHCVKSWNEVQLVKRELQVKQSWIFHGFRKTAILKEVLANELFIGIGPAIIFDKTLQKALLEIPLTQILLETDNYEKITIDEVYIKVAEIKEIELTRLENQIEENFMKIFNRIKI